VNHFGWLVLVVFALIWILNSFLRSGEEDKNANRRRNGGGGQSGRRKTEIEEFLEEVNRRRRQKTDQPQSPRSAEEAASMRTPMATRSSRSPAPARTEPRRQKAATPRVTRTVSPRELDQPAVEAVVVVDEPARPTIGQATLGQLTSVPERPAAAVQLTTMAPEIKAAPLAELAALLKSSEGLRAAMILQEVLGPPRCKQKG